MNGTGRILPDLRAESAARSARAAEAIAAEKVVTAPRRGRRGPARRITQEMVVALAADHTDREIADELHCSVVTVWQRKREAGLVAERAGHRRKVTTEQVLAMHAEKLTVDEMMARTKSSRGTIARARREAGLMETARAQRGRLTRIAPRAIALEKPAAMPRLEQPDVAGGRTIYPTQVIPVEGLGNVLVSGRNAWKIGAEIQKGRWKGFPVFTLTLEERATCPMSCAHWRSCYGNQMNWAKRIVAGAALEERLGHELAVLASRHPAGFAVRLHVLGDFYSVGYVDLWRGFLERFAPLHVFGFTARWQSDDPIAVRLVELALARWDRFAIRFSNAPVDECATVSIEHPLQKPTDAIICPQQLGLTQSCSTCALCWQSRRRIAFLRH
jgi:hypothetical protein